jgi:type VI protein secretion system component VasK
MESYQNVGIIVSIIGIIIGSFMAVALGVQLGIGNGLVGLLVILVSFVGLVLSVLNVKHHKNVGGALIVIGIVGNLLLIIPGIMAYRYKPEGKQEIKQQSMRLSDREIQDREIEDTRKKLADLEREKEIRDREDDKK